MVGMVVTISPSLSLYKMVVLPAASRPTMRIRISRLENSFWKSLVKVSPMVTTTIPRGDRTHEATRGRSKERSTAAAMEKERKL